MSLYHKILGDIFSGYDIRNYANVKLYNYMS